MTPLVAKNNNEHWWTKPRGDAHEAVAGTVDELDKSQSSRCDGYLRDIRQYTNRDVIDFTGSGFTDARTGECLVRLNSTRSCIDTAVAHMATERPRPLYKTEGGNYEQRQRGQALGKFMLGQFLAMKRYQKAMAIFRDAALFGIGVEKFFEDPRRPGKIASERIPPWELVFDEDEAARGMPRTMFQTMNVDKYMLAHEHPDYSDKIIQSRVGRLWTGFEFNTPDMCTVYESWHLPDGPNKPGRHIVCTSHCTLVDEEWTRDRYPFAFFYWGDPIIGWIPIGGAEEVAPLQLEVNYIAQKIQRLMTLATSFVWKEKGSGVGRLTNKDFGQYEYTGKPPIFQTVSSVSAEYFAHMDRLNSQIYALFGVSQLSATAVKPEGLDSGEALRTYADIGAKRWRHVGLRFQQYHLDAAECIYDVASDIKKRGQSSALRVLYAHDDEVAAITFDEAYLERDQYVLQAWPVSILPDTPEGKIAMIEKLAQAMPELAPYLPLLLAQHPDVAHAVELMDAPRKLADQMVGNILLHGRYEAPYPEMNLDLTRGIAQRELMKSYIENVPNERCSLLRRFIAQVDALQSVKAQTAIGPVPGMLPPPMTGGPSPTLASAQPPMMGGPSMPMPPQPQPMM